MKIAMKVYPEMLLLCLLAVCGLLVPARAVAQDEQKNEPCLSG
jgi:hypothetical protein